LIHILHPQSEQNRGAFPLAARSYRKSWAPHRTELDSIWTTSEPLFLFAWLAGFFSDRQEFPQEQMEALFLGMNYGLFRDFLAKGKIASFDVMRCESDGRSSALAHGTAAIIDRDGRSGRIGLHLGLEQEAERWVLREVKETAE